MIRFALAALIFLPSTLPLASEQSGLRIPVTGPVDAELISVIDGDTILVEARPWPQHTVTVLVRIRGIDAPELKARCASARAAASRARESLVELARGALHLTNIASDKYFGRVVADIATASSGDIGAALLARGLVRSYDGGRRTAQSC